MRHSPEGGSVAILRAMDSTFDATPSSDAARRDPDEQRQESRSLDDLAREPAALREQPALGASLDFVARARQGDRLALDDLFRRYQERVHRIARIRMGPRIRSIMESADLVQNTFLVAERRLPDFEPHSHAAIINWLARILQNQINDAQDYATAARRDKDREAPMELFGAGSSAGQGVRRELQASDPSPSAMAAEHELVGIHDACVHELEGDEREVILLRDYADGSWEFIREQLGRPTTDAVQQLHCRARTKLARLVSSRVGRLEQ